VIQASSPLFQRISQNYAAESGLAVSKHRGMLLSNFQRSLAAVVVGNLAYFALFPLLPPVLRHGITRFGIGKFDWGLLIDFAICTALYVLFGAIWPEKKPNRPKTQS
jgi:hypothetical protein